MARPARSTRSALRLVAPLALVGLVGCTGGGPPQVCSLVLLESSVSVDIGALPVDPATVGALLCVEDDCADRDPWFDDAEAARAVPRISRVGADIPDRDEVQVRVVLTDPGSGAEVYRGSGAVPVDVVEPNGPGCGKTRTLPPVTADPDGTLRS